MDPQPSSSPQKSTDPPKPPDNTVGDQRTVGEDEDVDYDKAFEMTGHGKLSYIALFSATCIYMHGLIEMVGFAYVADNVECDLKLTVDEKSLLGSAVFMGIVLTAICWGSLTDQYGRKKIMLPALIVTIICSIMSSVATKFWMMFIFRFLVGIFVSASSATICVYLGELETEKYRDQYIAIVVTVVSYLFCLVPALAWIIIPGTWSFGIGSLVTIKPWRLFMWLWSVPGVGGVVSLVYLPESPNFMFAKEESDEKILKTLERIYSENMHHSHNYPVHHLKHEHAKPHAHEGFKEVVKEKILLIKKPLLRPFFVTHYCMFVTFMLANGVYLWLPGVFNILADQGMSTDICTALKKKYETTPNKAKFGFGYHHVLRLAAFDYTIAAYDDSSCDQDAVNWLTYPIAIGMEIILVIPFTVVTVLIDKVNKCKLYVGMMSPCALGILLTALVPNLAAACVFLTFGVCSGSGASILSALVVEAFPTKLRALAVCTMFMMGHFGAITGNTLLSAATTGHCLPIFILIAVITAGSILSIAFLWPDVKVVQQIMESKNYYY